MTTSIMDQVTRNTGDVNNSKDFVQLVNDMVNHEKAKDMELIQTLREGMMFLRSEIINKQSTIDSLLKQLDRLSLAVNCNCQCGVTPLNNDNTIISDLGNSPDLSAHEANEVLEQYIATSHHSSFQESTGNFEEDVTNDNEEVGIDVSDVHSAHSARSSVHSIGKDSSVDRTVLRKSLIRERSPKPDEVFV